MTPNRVLVYRVQDADGRGPWKPGFSHVWLDDSGPDETWSETLMDLMSASALRALPRDRHYGCGCRSLEQLSRWFTPVEMNRLATLGYAPVRMWAHEILAESKKQVVFSRFEPLHQGATRLRWPVKERVS